MGKSQSSLVNKWLSSKVDKPKPYQITRHPVGVNVPLSFRQERLWFLQQLYPSNPFYHYAEGFEFRGKLKIEYLITSLEAILKRHSILRASFHAIENQVIQIVEESSNFEITSHDLRSLSGDELDQSTEEIIIKETNKHFNLETAPLFRTSILQFGDEHHLVILTLHHLIMDKWSMRLLRDELSANYLRLSSNNPLQPDPLVIEYADYAYWQRNRDLNEKNVAYWKEKLKGVLTQLRLPLTYKRPANTTFRGGFSSQEISSAVYEAVNNICRDSHATPYVFFLTVYNIMLSRLCQDEDIIVGSPFTERNSTQLEDLIGFFDDTLVLRSDLSANPRFIDLLEQVKFNVLEGLEHRDIPFEYLVKSLKPDRVLNQNPLFQVMFIFHQEPTTPSFGDNLAMNKKILDIGVAKFDLTLYVELKNDAFTMLFEYSKDLFDENFIKRLHGYFNKLLDEIIADPEQHLSELKMLSTVEEEQILAHWSRNPVPLPGADSVCQMFEKMAVKNPDRPAVVYENTTLSYHDLNVKAQMVAKCLIQNGIKTNDFVGLCTNTSLELIVGIFGIMKSGAGYFPIEPDIPIERMKYVIQDADIKFVLSQIEHINCFEDIDVGTIPIEVIIEEDVQYKNIRPVEPNGGHRAYLIYTSGSTRTAEGDCSEPLQSRQFNSCQICILSTATQIFFTAFLLYLRQLCGRYLLDINHWR